MILGSVGLVIILVTCGIRSCVSAWWFFVWDIMSLSVCDVCKDVIFEIVL